MPDANGMPTEAEWLEGRYPGAQEEHEAARQPDKRCEVCEEAKPDVKSHLCNQGTDDEEVLDFCDDCLRGLTEGER